MCHLESVRSVPHCRCFIESIKQVLKMGFLQDTILPHYRVTVIGVFLSVHTHTHTFNGPFPRTTRVGRYQKGKNNLDFTEARDSEWQWHQLGHMQVCTLLQTDNHASTSPLRFLHAGCPSCRPTNSVKALKASC